MTSLIVLGVAVVIISAGALLWRGRRRQRSCPTCGHDLRLLARAGDGPNASYDVLACDRCAYATTLVHGVRSDVAYCSTCTNRSLEIPAARLAGSPPRVGVRERCPLCGHERSITVVAREESAGGKVIPFPTDTARRAPSERADQHP